MRNPRVVVLDRRESLSRQVERVTSGLRPRPEVVRCNGVDAIEELSTDPASPDVVIAGPPVSEEDGFCQLHRLRQRAPETRLILAVDHWPTGSVRETLRTGALDILLLPVGDDELVEAVGKAMQPGPARPAEPAPAPDGHPGTVIAVVSATGGSGKTFFATNLAYHLGSRMRARCCLIDLDLQFGELSTALRLKPRSTLSDLLSQYADDDDLASRLEDHLVHHDSGIHLLAAPNEPADADAVTPEDVARVTEAARARFDYVIIDTPAALSEPVLAILDQADLIYALATLDLPSVRNLGILLSTLKKLKVPAERVKLLLNKVEPDVGIDVAGVSQYFPQGFSMVIPYGREVNRSLNMGQPVLAYSPSGEVSRSLDAGLRQMTDGAVGDARQPGAAAALATPSRRRFGRRQRKSA